jgi:hypothetical protein
MKYEISKFREHQHAIAINILDLFPAWLPIPAAINQHARQGDFLLK